MAQLVEFHIVARDTCQTPCGMQTKVSVLSGFFSAGRKRN